MKILYTFLFLLIIAGWYNNFIEPDDGVLGQIYYYSITITPILVLGLLCSFYFLPTLIAFDKNLPGKIGILVLNFAIGWTIIGWFALIGSVLNKSAYNTYEPTNYRTMTEEQIIDDVWEHLSFSNKWALKNTKFNEIGVKLHNSLGVSIRHDYNLWERYRFNFMNEDQHPNKITMRILEELWRRVHNATV